MYVEFFKRIWSPCSPRSQKREKTFFSDFFPTIEKHFFAVEPALSIAASLSRHCQPSIIGLNFVGTLTAK
jgi:hypothetical protein